MTKQRYNGFLLIILITMITLSKKMTFALSDIYTFIYFMVVVPGIFFIYIYYPKDKKHLRKQSYIFLTICAVMAVIIYLFRL